MDTILILYDGIAEKTGVSFHNMVVSANSVEEMKTEIENLSKEGFFNISVKYGSEYFFLVDYSVDDIAAFIENINNEKEKGEIE